MATATGSSSAIVNSLTKLLRSKDMVMAFGIVILVILLIVPLPSFLVDLLLTLNIAVAVGILLLTMYIKEPLEFSTFPTVLLLMTLLRLGINISVSRLILLDGSAGKIVDTFGNLMVGGNYVVGFVIFLMLMIIQFMVINSGAGRVAEVAARFTLDAMPGKQLAIDADLNAGLIDENESRRRRKTVENEADFYGAMDGASKFVRGDAIASIIIMLINALGGIVIGMLQKQMDVTTALSTYVLLTIGSGLAIQIPALLVSSAAGLIVTRSTSETSLGTELFGQLGKFNVLTVAAVIVGLMMLIPGLPKVPFALVSVGLGVAAYFAQKLKSEEEKVMLKPPESAPTEPETPEQMLEMVMVDPIEIEIGYSLIPLIDDQAQENLLRRITGIRRQIMSELGLILPVVRIRDNLRLQPNEYRIKIRGQEIANYQIMLDHLMAIPSESVEGDMPGITTSEPAFSLPAKWISENDRHQAEMRGYTVVTPISVICTHLTELVRAHAPELLSRQVVQEMLNQIRQKSPASVEGVVPELLSLGDLQNVLRNLLHERVPIRDLSGILEVLAVNAQITRDPNVLSEVVRQSMAVTISNQYRDNTFTLHVMTLAPSLENLLRNSLANSENRMGFQIDAKLAQRILVSTGEQMESMAKQGFLPVLICPRELRFAFRHLIEQSFPSLVVLAFSEVSQGTRVKAHGMINNLENQ
ncbi:MAG: flagellar biosynthesis protein FlhA [Anaerolineaceae bacterium]